MYHEDSDLGWRLRLAGWESVLAPGAVIHHDYDFTRTAAKFYWVERNRLINVLTHYRAATLALLAPALLAFEPVSVLYAARSGWLGQRLDVYGFFARPASWRYLAGQATRGPGAAPAARSRAAAVPRVAVPFGPVATPAVRFVLDPVFAAYWRMVSRLIAW